MTTQPFESNADEGTILELSAALHLDGLEFAEDKKTVGVTVIGLDLEDLITEHGAVVGVRQSGGPGRRSWQTVVRLAVEVYAATGSDVWAAQRAIDAHLADRWRPTREGTVRIDSWRNESAPARVMTGTSFLLASTWRVTSRDL